ncbi:MAG: redoxin domain-containing protein [Bacteroidales bacterium]|nr:redoxin domain-containing protein [Bacteroidales bacterium]
MKSKFIFTALIMLPALLVAQSYNINVQLKGLSKNRKVYLQEYYGSAQRPVDSTMSGENGMVHFTLPQSKATGLYHLKPSGNNGIDFIFNKNDIHLQTNLFHPIDSMEVVKSEENRIYFDFLAQRKESETKLEMLHPLVLNYPTDDPLYDNIKSRYDKIQWEENQEFNRLIEENEGTFAAALINMERYPYVDTTISIEERNAYLREHYFDNITFNDTSLLRSPAISSRVINYFWLYRNPNFERSKQELEFLDAADRVMLAAEENAEIYEYVVDYLIGGFERYGFNNVVTYIAETYQQSGSCTNEKMKKEMQQKVRSIQQTSIGSKAKEIKLENPQDKEIALSSLNNKYTLVIFWASWCPHCTKMLPDMKQLYDDYRDKSFEIYAVSLDNTKEEWTAAVEENKLDWINVSELAGWETQAARDYNVFGTPTYFIVNNNREIVAKPQTVKAIGKFLEDRL